MCRQSPKRASPDYDVSAWNGLLAPARTPDDIVAKIHADVVKIARTPEFIEQLQKQALEVDLLGPAEFRTFLARRARQVVDARQGQRRQARLKDRG